MFSTVLNAVVSLLLVVVGAAVAFLSNYLTERRKERSAFQTRRDASLFTLSADFAAAARELVHLVMQVDDGVEPRPDAHKIDAARLRLRTLMEQIRLLGGIEVQTAARLVVRHVYAMRVVLVDGGPDPRADEFPGVGPQERVHRALREFYVAVRRQLQVADADQLASLDQTAVD